MFRRTAPLRDPVTVFLDGAPVAAERGEPLAVALLGAGIAALARSPKLHRPRAPSCLRGGCDGCLARVGGVPNVMTCQKPALGGERIEAQNVVGSRRADLLRVTDWFFPHGIDHHHLLAGIPGAQDVMQSFARKMAGLGRLPAKVEKETPAARLEADVMVIGGGVSGITVAAQAAESGRRVVLVDDGLRLGGALSAIPERLDALLANRPLARVDVRAGSAAVGIYRADGRAEILVGSDEGLSVVRTHALVIATGGHDPALAVPSGDLPGVLSARAVCRLMAAGVHPDGPVAIVGEGFWAERLAASLGTPAAPFVGPSDVVRIKGTGRVRGVVVRSSDAGSAKIRERTIGAVVVAVALPAAPAFELAAQAGAHVVHDPSRGYTIERDSSGRAGPGLWAVGECTGADFDPDALERDAERVAADVERELGALTPR